MPDHLFGPTPNIFVVTTRIRGGNGVTVAIHDKPNFPDPDKAKESRRLNFIPRVALGPGLNEAARRTG